MRFLALFPLLALALAQVPIGVNLPEGTSLSLSAEEVVFDLTQSPFPPPSFPYAYAPTAPPGPLTLRLFTNLEGGFAVEVEATPLLAEGGAQIPSSQVEYRLNGGPWIPLGPKIILLTGSGPTAGYQSYVLEFRLVLTGQEVPGVYRGSLLFTLSRL
ncbi:MAG: hypothetical protein ACK4G4_03025 [Thermus sp.]|uniref:hypothetical protein n=1 Tax=Thermus sp. TaxID=275 RepID=UPI00391DB937